MGGVKSGTSSSSHYISKCKALNKFKEIKLQEIILDNVGKLRSRKFDQKAFRAY